MRHVKRVSGSRRAPAICYAFPDKYSEIPLGISKIVGRYIAGIKSLHSFANLYNSADSISLTGVFVLPGFNKSGRS